MIYHTKTCKKINVYGTSRLTVQVNALDVIAGLLDIRCASPHSKLMKRGRQYCIINKINLEEKHRIITKNEYQYIKSLQIAYATLVKQQWAMEHAKQ